MKKKYIDQMMFDYLAATVAKLSLMYPRSDEQITEELWSGYQDMIVDDNVRADVLRAARIAKEYLQKCEDPTPSQFFHDLQHHIKHYDDKGSPRRFRFLGGLFFMKSVQNPRRVDDFLKTLQVYYAGRTLGVMPRAKP